jgi:glycosyltransferase involved in cell wall biosynthesis
MRILLLVDCYLPYSKSSATQMHDMAMELRRQNHEVVVLTPSDRISRTVEINPEQGVRVVRVRTGKIKGASRVLRALEEARLSSLVWSRANRFLQENPADLIVFYSPTIFWGALVRRLKSIWKCPAYLILRDIFPSWAADAGLLSKGLVYQFFCKKEMEQYEVADRIAVQSPANLQYFAREFPSSRYRLEVLYNWMRLHEEALPPTNYREQLGLQGKVIFFYGGNLGVAQDIDNIFRLALRLAEYENLHLVLVGEGSEVPRLKKFIAEKQTNNIHLLPAVSHREYLSMLSEFDVGILSLDRRLKTHNVPGKLLGYMYWGMPILASINSGNDLFEILGRGQAGFCFLNGDDDSFCAAALRLANDPELRAGMGKNSRKLLERLFSVEAAVRQVTRDFQSQVTLAREADGLRPVVTSPVT